MSDQPAGRTLKVTQIRSGFGAKPKARGTLRALGLGRIGRSNTLPDRPEIRGMIRRVPHLVEVTPGEGAAPDPSLRSEAPVRSEAAPAASRTEAEEER